MLAAITRGFGPWYIRISFLFAHAHAGAPCALSGLPNNVVGYSKRATAIAMMATFILVGGIISTCIYPTKDAPYYALGAKFNLSMVCIAQGLIVCLPLWLRRWDRIKGGDPAKVAPGCGKSQ